MFIFLFSCFQSIFLAIVFALLWVQDLIRKLLSGLIPATWSRTSGCRRVPCGLLRISQCADTLGCLRILTCSSQLKKKNVYSLLLIGLPDLNRLHSQGKFLLAPWMDFIPLHLSI